MADQTLLNIGREGQLNPIQADDLRKQLQSEGISFTESAGPNGTRITASGSAGDSTSAMDLAKQMYGLLSEYQKPAISTLESGRGQIAPMFASQKAEVEAEKQPLEDRYQSLLKDITGYTTKATAQEFGRRGIPLSSGVYESTLAERIEPQVRGIGLEKESGLRNLTQMLGDLTRGEAQMGLDLNQAIAAIQAATGPSSIQQAMSLYQAQQQSQQQAASLALQKYLSEQELGWQKEQWPTEQAYKEALTQYYQTGGTSGSTWTPDNPFA